ncbi:hypothetical protein HHI36_006139 [Cryptolaemus montrouzieri]|uniref:V-type proton ATPase subunit F n=1 Tax=Cryptolaemus montrouzieri TaxID=559131 RepID=A0ABD2NW96_9CUCU
MSISKIPTEFAEYYFVNQLIAIVGEEDTVVGFLLAGIGECGKNNQTNFAIVPYNATEDEIMNHLQKFILREQIAIILVTYEAAHKIKHFLVEYKSFLPVILEIPSKYHHYNPAEDEIMMRLAQKYCEGDERRASTSSNGK